MVRCAVWWSLSRGGLEACVPFACIRGPLCVYEALGIHKCVTGPAFRGQGLVRASGT